MNRINSQFAFYYLNYKPIKESQLSVRISSSSNNNKSYLNLLKDFNNALSLNSFGDSLVRQGMKAISFYILQEELIGQKGALEFIAKTVEELEKGIAENSYNLEYLTDVINIYTRIAKYEEYFIEYTEALINKCLRLNPQYDRLYFMLADILVLKKDFNKAVEVASNIAARGPDNDITYFELALIAIRSSNDEVASNALEKVKAIRMAAYDYTVADGDTVFSVGELRRMAQVYLESNKLHEAIHLYKLVLTYLQDDGPAAARLHFKMANIYHIIGDSENTIKEIKKAAELDPDNYAEEAERIIYSLNK